MVYNARWSPRRWVDAQKIGFLSLQTRVREAYEEDDVPRCCYRSQPAPLHLDPDCAMLARTIDAARYLSPCMPSPILKLPLLHPVHDYDGLGWGI